MKLYLVGGAVRDHLLGMRSKDLDFAVEADSFEEMTQELVAHHGLHIYQSRPEFVTLRGRIPLGPDNFGGIPKGHEYCSVDADFTLCRKEAQYHDRRHPSSVTPADILTDLSRRDFTINAIAVAMNGNYIDPYGGRRDLECRILHTVGLAQARFDEDPLRILRAVRFICNLDLYESSDIFWAFQKSHIVDLLKTLPVERIRQELNQVKHWRKLMYEIMSKHPLIGDSLERYFPTLTFRAEIGDRNE